MLSPWHFAFSVVLLALYPAVLARCLMAALLAWFQARRISPFSSSASGAWSSSARSVSARQVPLRQTEHARLAGARLGEWPWRRSSPRGA